MKELDALGFDEQDISTGGYKITTTLISQAFVKFVLIIINLILMLFMVNFE